jgi:ketosteroid isomerase-like protein
MKKYFTILAVLMSILCFAQNKDEQAIRQILANQEKAWNKGDLITFMIGYWENDSLVYIGKNGPTYGYMTTLNNYKKNYPDTSHMGKLKFQLLSVKPLNTDHYFVIGKFHLTRTVGDASGYFTLLFRKINGVWKAIADHSS